MLVIQIQLKYINIINIVNGLEELLKHFVKFL